MPNVQSYYLHSNVGNKNIEELLIEIKKQLNLWEPWKQIATANDKDYGKMKHHEYLERYETFY